MHVHHLYIIFGEKSIQVLCPFLIGLTFVFELLESIIGFEYGFLSTRNIQYFCIGDYRVFMLIQLITLTASPLPIIFSGSWSEIRLLAVFTYIVFAFLNAFLCLLVFIFPPIN